MKQFLKIVLHIRRVINLSGSLVNGNWRKLPTCPLYGSYKIFRKKEKKRDEQYFLRVLGLFSEFSDFHESATISKLLINI